MKVALSKRLRHVAKSAMQNNDELGAALKFLMSIDYTKMVDTKSYTDKMSKWAKDVVAGLDEQAFWYCLEI